MNFNTANSANLQKQNNFKYSVLWLIVNLTVIAALLILKGRIGFYYWIALISVVAVIWALRYKRALRQIARPGLWISFAVITMLTAFVFSRLQSDSFSVKDAILIGLEMNFRAILLIMGFTVLGTELYNPKIRIFFANSYFKQLPVALEMSLDSLPAMIANMPNVKIMFKNPSMVVSHLFSYAEYRLEELRKGNRRKIYIITGQIGSGKTTLLNEFVQKAKSENIPVSGIISTRIIENNKTIGYDVVNISNGKTAKFLRKTGNRDQQMVGKYFIYTEGLKTGYEALQNDKTELVVVDEIGKLELDEKGWFEPVVQFMQNPGKYMILSVREEVIDAVISKFGITPEIILNTRENEFDLFDVIYKGKVRITEKQSILSSE